LTLALEHVAASDRLPDAILLLVDGRLTHLNFANRRPQPQVAVAVEAELLRAGESHRDLAGIAAGRDFEVIFELPVVAVIDDVDAGIDLAIADPGIHGNVLVPVL